MAKELRTKVTKDGMLELSIAQVEKPTPGADEVLVEVKAAPINPSDLALLLTMGGADFSTIKTSGSGDSTVTTMKIKPEYMANMTPRLDLSMPAGNEGAGVVIDAGENAKHLIGKVVSLAGGSMYSTYKVFSAKMCLVMDDGTEPIEAAFSYVNPLTALAFIETMKMEGHTALVHTAAASNLGQMLVKLCKKDGIPLVNVVRKQEQVDILKKLGAEYIVNSSDADFEAQLANAIHTTGATLAFDATGGGNNGLLPGQILAAMEVACVRNMKVYSRYGSETHKQVYIYGGLDRQPSILKRSYGMAWGLGGWLLMPAMAKIGMEGVVKMRQRVAAEIKTTFSSTFKSEITLAEALQPEIIAAYAKQATGEKYVINPSK